MLCAGRVPGEFLCEGVRRGRRFTSDPFYRDYRLIELIAEVNAATTDSAREAAQARLNAARRWRS
jgi:hypothetical protein